MQLPPSMSTPAMSTPADSSINVHSCNVHPCNSLRQCPHLQCPPLQIPPSMSTPAMSTPAFSSVNIHSCNVHPRFFHAPTMSTPAISVNPAVLATHICKSENLAGKTLRLLYTLLRFGILRLSLTPTNDESRRFRRLTRTRRAASCLVEALRQLQNRHVGSGI